MNISDYNMKRLARAKVDIAECEYFIEYATSPEQRAAYIARRDRLAETAERIVLEAAYADGLLALVPSTRGDDNE
jgi:hypothetical protein